MSAPPPFSLRFILQYAVLALPLAFAGLPLYIHAPDFYTRNLGVNISLIGIVLMGVRLLDAFQDPVIGYISDRYAQRRFTILLVGVVLLILGMAAVFYGPVGSISPVIWFAIGMIGATTGFSIVTINFSMIGGLWRDAPTERTRIAAWREALTLLGLLIAVILPTVLQFFPQFSGPVDPGDVYILSFWIFAAVMVVGLLAFGHFMAGLSADHPIYRSSHRQGLSFLPILLGIDKRFFILCFLTHLAAAFPGVTVLFFIRDYLAADHLAGLFLFLYFISGAVFMALWVRLADRLGREKAWFWAMILAVVTFIWATSMQPGDYLPYGVICVLSGAALGADLSLPPAILADRITALKAERQATQYYALLAFLPKISLAIAGGVSFLILGAFGFAAGTENTPQAVVVLIMLYALVPCLIKLLAAWLLWNLSSIKERIDEQNGDSHGAVGIS